MKEFIAKKRWQMRVAIVLLVLALSVYIFVDSLVSYLLLILIFALVVGLAAFEYRVDNGLYGNNETEARQIIEDSKQ